MSGTIRVNGEERPLGATTVAGLLREESLDPQAPGIAVALNGAVVPRRAWAATSIAQGDEVEIVKPFSGG